MATARYLFIRLRTNEIAEVSSYLLGQKTVKATFISAAYRAILVTQIGTKYEQCCNYLLDIGQGRTRGEKNGFRNQWALVLISK